MTNEALIEALELDAKLYNRRRIIWELTIGAGWSDSLDPAVIRKRTIAIQTALGRVLAVVANEPPLLPAEGREVFEV